MGEWVVPGREETMARLMRGYARVAGFARDHDYTVADRLEERAADHADTPFILFEDQRLTFAEVNARANRVAHAARAAGLGKGDVAALMMYNRPDFVAIWLGLAKIGMVTALINTSATGNVLAHAMKQVGAKALIVDAELGEAVAELPDADIPDLLWEQAEEGRPLFGLARARDFNADMAAASDADPDRALRAGVKMGDPLYLIFTSGTTGLPKAAKMSHMRFVNAGEMMGGLMEFGPGNVFYCVLPLYHGAGGMVVPSTSLAFGVPFVLRRKFSASGFWPDVRRHGVTAFYYIGEICRYLLNAPARADDADNSLRVMTGAGLKGELWTTFQQRFGVAQVFEGLGSTEANYGITNVDNKVGSVGRVPYPAHTNMKFVRYDVETDDHIRDADGRLVEARPGEVAELIAEVLGGTGVAGYFEGYTSAEATEQKLLRDVVKPGDVWFRSGDLVRFDAEDYFYFVDRIGNTYRWKGENVSTEEVAAVLGGFAGPDVVNVYGVKVPATEGRAGMVALTYADPAAFDPHAFYQFATARLAHYAVPVFVRLSREAEMTTTFKLRKVELQREGYAPDRVHGDALFVADAAAGRYVPLTPDALDRLGIAPFAAEN